MPPGASSNAIAPDGSAETEPGSFQTATHINRRFAATLGLFAAGALLVTAADAQDDFYKGKQVSLIVGYGVGYGTGGGYCWVENVGRLVNTIGEQSERQPNEPERQPAERSS